MVFISDFMYGHWFFLLHEINNKYAEKPESPGGILNGTHHSIRNFPGKVGGRVRRSTFPTLFGFPGRCANHFNFLLFLRFFSLDKTKWRTMGETKVSLKTAK